MSTQLQEAFERELVKLPLEKLRPVRALPDGVKDTIKYKRIAKSIAEVGTIEPLVVAKTPADTERYDLLDGHLRLAALVDQHAELVCCLIAKDDESYTYNRRVCALTTIQEHFMILRAIERGVPEDRIATAVNVDLRSVRRRRSMLDGISSDVTKLLTDKMVSPLLFDVLRQMKSHRQLEAVQLMSIAQNFTATYARALLIATKPADRLASARPAIKGLSAEQMARMEAEMSSLQQQLGNLEWSLGDTVLQLVVATGYVRRLVGNSNVRTYLEREHPELLSGICDILQSTSLSD